MGTGYSPAAVRPAKLSDTDWRARRIDCQSVGIPMGEYHGKCEQSAYCHGKCQQSATEKMPSYCHGEIATEKMSAYCHGKCQQTATEKMSAYCHGENVSKLPRRKCQHIATAAKCHQCHQNVTKTAKENVSKLKMSANCHVENVSKLKMSAKCQQIAMKTATENQRQQSDTAE